jgi:hypothetical protein
MAAATPAVSKATAATTGRFKRMSISLIGFRGDSERGE